MGRSLPYWHTERHELLRIYDPQKNHQNLRLKLKHGAARPKVRVDITERGAVLAEVTVEGGREALEGHAKVFVETLHDGGRQRALFLSALAVSCWAGGQGWNL